ncbi:MAG TPA: GlxA family transcriptional regulator [Magnetospirillaceae bacterium]|nr:GlxA family transcriptional regulator [Magnetospirillaceae bacterium]
MTRPYRIIIVGFPPAQMLDIAGPVDVLSVANSMAEMNGRSQPYEILLAGPRSGPLATTSGVPFYASHGVLDEALTGDTLLLSGGAGARAAVRDSELMAALTALCSRVERVGSICTGAFPLAATGFLDHRRATTHWAHFDEFGALFPQVEIDRDALFVNDGKYHSSAGISAGIDFTLALVEQDLGRQIALQVARELVVFLKRPGGQSQFSAELAAQMGAAENDRFSEIIRWIGESLDGDLSVEKLAERAAMSPRNFARRFAEIVKTTPAQFVQLRRIDAARQLLTDSDCPIGQIARLCGFPSADAMCLAFHRQLNVTPRDFRDRFRTAAG